MLSSASLSSEEALSASWVFGGLPPGADFPEGSKFYGCAHVDDRVDNGSPVRKGSFGVSGGPGA